MANDLRTIPLRDKIAALPDHEREAIAERRATIAQTHAESDAAEERAFQTIRQTFAGLRKSLAHLDPKCQHCGHDLDERACSECDPEAHLERRGAFRRGL